MHLSASAVLAHAPRGFDVACGTAAVGLFAGDAFRCCLRGLEPGCCCVCAGVGVAVFTGGVVPVFTGGVVAVISTPGSTTAGLPAVVGAGGCGVAVAVPGIGGAGVVG